MADDKNGKGSDKLESGIGFLCKDEWFQLQTFVLICKHWNPTTVEKMARDLKMEKPAGAGAWDPTKDPKWDVDFTKTVKDYAELANYCDDSERAPGEQTGFWNKIKPGMVNLADDIVQYNNLVKGVYTRLISLIDAYDIGGEKSVPVQAKLAEIAKTWDLPNPSQESITVKQRIMQAFERLQTDADKRKSNAVDLETLLNKFHSNLIASNAKFETSTQNYETKYGSESEAVKNLRKDYESLKEELEVKRKKEKDEIIVLGTSPLYLILWPFGPLIMAGVQIGVGADLGILRARIKKLVGDIADKKKDLDMKESFMASYGSVKKDTKKTSERIKAILPAVAKLKDGWTSVAADLKGIVEFLRQGGKDAANQNWWNSTLQLQTTQDAWAALAARADHFRLNATVREVPNVEEFLKEVTAA